MGLLHYSLVLLFIFYRFIWVCQITHSPVAAGPLGILGGGGCCGSGVIFIGSTFFLPEPRQAAGGASVTGGGRVISSRWLVSTCLCLRRTLIKHAASSEPDGTEQPDRKSVLCQSPVFLAPPASTGTKYKQVCHCRGAWTSAGTPAVTKINVLHLWMTMSFIIDQF